MIAMKDKTSYKDQLEQEFSVKEAALTSRLDAKIAEVAQLKCIMQVKLKKINE